MNDYLGQTKWALTRRASPWPVLRLALLVALFAFLAGVLVGSVLSSSGRDTLQVVGPVGISATERHDASAGNESFGDSTEPTRIHPEARGHASEDDRMSLLPVEEKAAGSTPAGAVEAIIRNAAVRWSVDPDRMVRVAKCESSLNPNAIGDNGLAVGLFQFHAETFFRMAAPLGIFEDLRTDPAVSANVAARAFSMGRAGEWSCRG